MIKKYSYLCMFLLLILQLKAFGQSDLLTGRVLDSETGMRVYFAHIQNYSAKTASFSDTSGYFTIEGGKGDTLVVSAIGYYYKKLVVDDNLYNSDVIPVIEIDPRVYVLEEAVIYMPGSYENFKNDFLNFNEEDEIRELREEILVKSRIEAQLAYDEAIARQRQEGISIVRIPILSRDERERLELQEIIRKQGIRDLIYVKFNPEIIREVTGLTNDNEIIKFMLFCDFSDEYLLSVNAYYLMEQIAAKFEVFKLKQK